MKDSATAMVFKVWPTKSSILLRIKVSAKTITSASLQWSCLPLMSLGSIYLNIWCFKKDFYLAVLGLSCDTWDCGCLVVASRLSCSECQKHSHNLKVESYFIWWECLGLWAQETASHSVTQRKLLQGGRRGSQTIYKFGAKGAGTLNIKDLVSS